jgi:hypothetical protein
VDTPLNLYDDNEVKQGVLLLNWAYENWLGDKDIAWPPHLPCPAEQPVENEFLKLAHDLCLCSMAFLIHHELAHIKARHPSKSIENEKEADAEAANWILHRSLEENDLRFIKRSLGIAIPLEVLITKGILTGEYGGRDHLPSYDRMLQILGSFITDKNHVVWGVVIAILKLHLDAASIKTPNVIYDSFLGCAEAYANILAEKDTRNS